MDYHTDNARSHRFRINKAPLYTYYSIWSINDKQTYIYLCMIDCSNYKQLYHSCIGFVVHSGLVLFSYIWLLYIIHLALKLFFPLKSIKLLNSGYRRAIYVAEFLIVVLIGTAPSIYSAVHSKYRISTFPPINCGGYDDRTHIFYTAALPILTAVCVSLILMILILYKVHIVS